jgi:hypothetical protein
MEFLITESQLKTILTEQEKSQLGDYMKQLNAFTKSVVNRVHKVYGFNIRMLVTWGTAVAGLMLPLDQWIRSGNFDITDDQRMLILVAISSILFFESKRPVSKLIKTIKEEGLEDVFEQGLRKGSELKEAFIGFMNSVKITISSFLDILSYAFLIPIISDIQSLAESSTDPKQAALMIAQRLAASGVTVIGSQVLSRALKKIIDRIK